ncbi:MAG TPA: BON domain-containing protein [Pseudolabrys sp.]
MSTERKAGITSAAVFACAIAMANSSAFAQQTSAEAPVSAPSADNTKINQRDRSAETIKPTDQPNASADIKLAAAVRSEIVNDKSLSMMAHNVKLVAANGVVTLRGPVASDGEKQKVGKCAAAVSGVSHVDNQLDVKTN